MDKKIDVPITILTKKLSSSKNRYLSFNHQKQIDASRKSPNKIFDINLPSINEIREGTTTILVHPSKLIPETKTNCMIKYNNKVNK